MAQMTNALRHEYHALYDSCITSPGHSAEVAAAVKKMKANRRRYQAVGKPLRIPWYVVAVIHAMEGSLSFSTHLHNGDPLTSRTVNAPAGRPPRGQPPFKWEQSARDALTFDNFASW